MAETPQGLEPYKAEGLPAFCRPLGVAVAAAWQLRAVGAALLLRAAKAVGTRSSDLWASLLRFRTVAPRTNVGLAALQAVGAR